jgi:PAS domain S-box-containing protein
MKLTLTSPIWSWSALVLTLLFIGWSLLLLTTVQGNPDELAGKWHQLNILVIVSGCLALFVTTLLSIYQRNSARRQRIEEALRESEALYHSLVESLPQNILRKDRAGRFSFGNQRFCSSLGKPLSELLGKTDFDFFPEQLAAKYRRDDMEVIETGTTLERVEEHVRPTGEKLFVQVVKTPIYDARGMIAGIQGIFWDVTERKRVEEALVHQRYLLNALMDNVPDSIYFKDTEGHFTCVSKALADWLGLSGPDLAVGKTDHDFFRSEYALPAQRDEQEVMHTGDVLRAREETGVFPDGRERCVLTTKMPLREPTGKIIGTFGISRDITQRKQAEEAVRASERRYRQLTEASQDAIVVADQQGLITLFNPAAERMFGHQTSEVVGQPLTRLMPPEFHERHQNGFQRYLQTREARLVGRTVELRGRRKDGAEFPLEMSLSAIDLGGEMQFLGAIRDLSERNRMRALLVQNEKLVSIGLLSAGIAHEINNPLAFVANNLVVLENDIKGLLGILDIYEGQRARLAATVADFLARLTALEQEMDLPYVRCNLGRVLSRTREGVQRVARIVQSLRGLARTGPTTFQDVSLEELVEASVEMIRSRLRQGNIEVELDVGTVSRCRCVPTQISQVLLNLFVNALQAIEATGRDRGGRIRVGIRRVDDEMRIEIADNGCGIDPDDMPRLFDPFFTTKPVGEGTGLGLSITHGIVTGHGGKIEVDSRPGQGSCFRLRLPVDPKRGLT